MARDDDSSRSGCENLPQTPDSPTSAGFNSDQLPFNTIQNYTNDDDEASVDPEIIRDEPDDVVNEEEDEGEDLFNDNFMEYALPLSKAQAVAHESLAIWCSLASRLGLWALKAELEDLLCCPSGMTEACSSLTFMTLYDPTEGLKLYDVKNSQGAVN